MSAIASDSPPTASTPPGTTSLRERLKLVNGLHILLLLALAGMALYSIDRMHRDFRAVARGTVPLVQTLEELRFAVLRIVSSTTELAFLQAGGADADIDEPEPREHDAAGVAVSVAVESEEREEEEIEAAAELFRDTLSVYRGIVNESFPDEVGHVEEIEREGAALIRASAALIARIESGVARGQVLEAKEELEKAERVTLVAIDTALQHQAAELASLQDRLQAIVSSGRGAIAAFAVLLAMVAVWVARHMNRHVTRPVEDLTAAVNRVSRGDAAVVNVAAQGEVGVLANAFQDMVNSLDRTTVSRDFLDRILSSMSDALIVLDCDGRVTMANGAVYALLGHTPHSLDGAHVSLITGCDPSARGESLLPALQAIAGHDGTARLHAASGDERPVSLTVSALGTLEGEATGAVLLAQDVSGLLAVQADLREARDRAEAAAMSKSVFLANMSHEIRTPLNGMLGMVELMGAGATDTRQKHYAYTAQRSGEALLAVINDILDFSKVEAGFLALNDSVFSLCDLVEDLGSMFADSARRKDLEFVIDLDPGVPECVRGDCARLRQVLTNLVGNAIKFTAAGEVVLSIAIGRDDGAVPEVRFEVRDTGIGIAPDRHAVIFDAFAQADESTTRRYGGTGLGLAISAALVELMGGKLGVNSAPGEGATFQFSVALAVSESATAAPMGEALRGARVLVVDDNATNRTVLAHQLESWGAHCQVAGGGMSALESLQAISASDGAVDLVVLDMHMPGMDGLALARAIREAPSVGDVKLVMLSSIADQVDRDVREQLGIECHLTKPVHGRELARALDAVLRGTHDEQVPVAKPAQAQLHGRVLVAEDHPVNQENAREMLHLLGLEVTLVENGRLAVEAVIDGDFDVVLMDWQMPEMDGLEATREIRRHEAQQHGTPHIPIIAVTANALDDDRETCLACGMDDYVSKPFRLAALRSALLRWLDSPAAARVPDAHPVPVAPDPDAGPQGPLDPEVIAEIRDVNRQTGGRFAQRLFDSYFDAAPRDLKDLRGAVRNGDSEAARKRAHALKGASANVGALMLSKLCLSMEQCAKEQDLAAVGETLVMAEAEFESVLGALTRERRDAA